MKNELKRKKEKLVSYALAASLLLGACTEKSNSKKVYVDGSSDSLFKTINK